MLQVPGHGTDPLLRRPFSLCAVDHGSIHLLMQVRGTGTKIFTTCVPGQVLNAVGPLGNGFTIPETLTEAVIIAGGIGIAPLGWLAHGIRSERPDCTVRFFYGARTKTYTQMLARLPLVAGDRSVATEDGTDGYHGRVTDLLDSLLAGGSIKKHPGLCLYCCGPDAMLSALAARARSLQIACQLSREAMMACGVGACMGCVVAGSRGDYKRVCVEGPVFDSTDFI